MLLCVAFKGIDGKHDKVEMYFNMSMAPQLDNNHYTSNEGSS